MPNAVGKYFAIPSVVLCWGWANRTNPYFNWFTVELLMV